MTTTKYSNKIKKLPQDLKAPLFRSILNNSFLNFSWGTSAEAYMTYFKFNRCTINLCVRPSTNAHYISISHDIASSPEGIHIASSHPGCLKECAIHFIFSSLQVSISIPRGFPS